VCKYIKQTGRMSMALYGGLTILVTERELRNTHEVQEEEWL
jgi:hypothetical protein